MRSNFFSKALWGLLPFAVCCLNPSRGSGLTLDEAVREALQHNPDILQAAAARDESRFAAKEARSKRYPRLSQIDQYTTGDDVDKQLPDSNQVEIGAEETLFQAGLWSDVRRLKNLEQGAAADLDQKKVEIALLVKESYCRALSASEKVAVWEDARSEFSDILKLVAPKFSVGSVPEYDYAKIRYSIAQFRGDLLDSQKELDRRLEDLGELMGTAPPSSVEPLPDASAPPEIDTAAVFAAALSGRPDFKSEEARLSAQKFETLAAKRERWPQVKASEDYGYSARSMPEASIGWGLNALVTLPLFDFGQIGSRIDQSDAREKAQQYRLDRLKLKIRGEIANQAREVETAWEKLRLVRESLPDARKAYRSSLHRYRTSLAPMTELSDAHDLWVQARMDLIQAEADYRVARARWDAAQGLWEEKP